ncbi:hypothetical protein [Methylocapsa sp. S129]|nr:hypothetical protein [Methylocapsa sp. S129]
MKRPRKLPQARPWVNEGSLARPLDRLQFDRPDQFMLCPAQ